MPGTLAAEQLPTYQTLERPALYAVPDPSDGLRAQSPAETEFEAEAQSHFNAWLGSVAVQTAEMAEYETPSVNILERIKAARDGDPEAQQWLNINVDTATFEAVFKKDYASDIYMDKASDGSLTQFGQSNDSIHHNAVIFRPDRHEVLQAITSAENLNRHRIEAAFEAGKLRDYYYVVLSLVPDGVPEEQLGPKATGTFWTA